MDKFQMLVEKELAELHESSSAIIKNNNVSPTEWKNNPHIIIRQSDKGGSIIVLDKECNKLLDDKEVYVPLKSDPTPNITTRLSTNSRRQVFGCFQ
ncbi:hypothetical protein GDO81_019334 [Engystomops pustulosus]|uniref:Uncharacterized protein n=1 Tax=Engystomops pustulosus TaxID=76066 RepID=A0AAV6ZIA0_ENGPU|nr:hypothetical protein GDO81_019334 [Engystomops pustulosus]